MDGSLHHTKPGSNERTYSVALASPASALPSTSSSEHSPVPFLTIRRVTTKGRSPRLGKDRRYVSNARFHELTRQGRLRNEVRKYLATVFAVGSCH